MANNAESVINTLNLAAKVAENRGVNSEKKRAITYLTVIAQNYSDVIEDNDMSLFSHIAVCLTDDR